MDGISGIGIGMKGLSCITAGGRAGIDLMTTGVQAGIGWMTSGVQAGIDLMASWVHTGIDIMTTGVQTGIGWMMSGMHAGIDLPAVNPLWGAQLADALLYDPAAPLQIPSAFMLAALLLFFAVHGLLHRRHAARNLFTALFSLYLYYKLAGGYVLLLLFIAASDFLIAKAIGGCTPPRTAENGVAAAGNGKDCGAAAGNGGAHRNKALLALNVTLNVAILVFFKANGVFADFIGALSEGSVMLRHIAVPAGISFFCFQSISYVADTYHGKISPLRRFRDYLLLLAFFPKMFLGPLVRNSDFIAQMRREEATVTREDCGEATRLIVAGLLKFCVLSKMLGQLFVAPAFAGTLGDDGFTALMAVYAFTFQLYCDFSGYTDLASGISLLAGFRLPLNFRLPYHSATITEFWRRWHISLSSWLRDYLYIPLGGNRRGVVRTYLNLLLTMLLGGLWHGVGVMFVLWGLWHGVLLCLHKFWMQRVPGAAPAGDGLPLWRRATGVAVTFNAVAFGWLMFRSPDWGVFTQTLHDIFCNFTTESVPAVLSANAPAFIALAAAVLLHAVPTSAIPRLDRACAAARIPGQAILIALAVWLAMQCDSIFFSAATSALPIYANF